VVTIHNTLSLAKQNASGARAKVMPNFMRHCFPWADEIVAVSEGVADDFAAVTGLERSRITTIYNPVISTTLTEKAKEPVDHPWFAPGQPPVVLAVGRLTKQKDFPTLIRAFDCLRRERPVRLMILGEGEERMALEGSIRQLGLNDSVSLPGFVDNPYPYLSRAGVFVLSSKWEGLPTVLIEALAVGVPVVSTDCKSGPREILDDGKYGQLVPVGDSAALAKAIEKALNQAEPNYQEACQRFTWEASIEAYMNVSGVTTYA
jgi:glycosyltransferase involved in cell wall biosynthesis